MTQGFYGNHKNVNSDEESARRKSFIERMSRKLEIKESLSDER